MCTWYTSPPYNASGYPLPLLPPSLKPCNCWVLKYKYKNSWKTQIYFSLLYSTIYLAAVFCLYLLFLELHCSELASVQIRKQFFTQQQNTLRELINSQWWADTGNKIQTELSRLVLVFIRFGINDLPDRDFGRHSLDFLDLKLILESLPRFGSDFVQSVFISLPVRRRRCCMLETTKLFGKLCFSWFVGLCLLFF